MQQEQILKAEVFEGEQRHFITNINIDLGESATLHVPLNMTVSGCTVNLKGKVTFNNLIVENGGEVILEPTSMTAKYSGGVYDISDSTPGIYSLGYIGLKFGSTFKPSGGLQLIAVSMDIKRYIVMYSDFVDLKIATLTMERGAELNVAGKALESGAPATSHGSNKNGGSYASEGGVGNGYNVNTVSTPYGTIYNPLLQGSKGGSGGSGGGYISIQTDTFTLDGILRANGDSSTSGGGGSGGSIYATSSTMLKGFGLMESNGGDTSSSGAGGGSGGRIAAYAKNDLFSGVGTYRAKGGASPATNGRGGPGSIYTKVGSGKNEYETLTVDNENGQTVYYLTLNENNTGLSFDLVNIKNYAKLQMTEDIKQRTLNILSVNGDGTGLIRMRQNQTGTLERFSLDVLISKLEINLELHNGGEFILSETTTILGKGTTALDLDGIMRGAVNLILGTERHMRMGSNAWIIPLKATELSSQARVSFGLLQLDPGSSLDFDNNTGAEMLVGTLNAKFKSRITADYFNITCSNINIELEAKLSAASEDRVDSDIIDILIGKANGTYGGAGHGGVGGGHSTIAGDSYGSLYNPIDAGSRPRSTGGKGGGKVYLKAGLSVINDGEISVNGSSSTLGGGSGGSIWIETYHIEGYGIFSTVGGSGSGSYGAGSAGRISINSTVVIQYEGDYLVFGGAGASDELAAGGGTVYLEDIRKGVPYRRLLLDNFDRSIEKYSTIDEKVQTQFYFDEVHIMRKAALQVRDKGIDIFMDVRQLFGDRSGLLHVHNNHRFIIEYEQGIRQALTSGVNFIIDYGAEMIIPAISYVYGKGITKTGYPESRSVQIYGRFTGVANFILGFETLVYIGKNGHTAMLGDGTYTDKGYTYLYRDDDGDTTFGTVDLRAYSTIKYAPDIPMLSNIGYIDCRYKSVISAESIHLNASTLNIEAGSEVTTSATDRTLDTLDELTGLGTSVNTADVATGGGHASKGGGLYDQTDHTSVREGGKYYGSLYTPNLRGSAGGSSSTSAGGKGGGIVDLNIAKHLLVDGEVSADGSNGQTLGGGGSGGSIYIKSYNLEGHGIIGVNGGSGASGGAGGRIGLHLETQIYYFGSYNNLGGSGNNGYLSGGGPGSVYIKDTRNGRGYEQLHLDNNKRTWDHYFILEEPGITKYYFDEVHLYKNVTLQLKEGDGVKRTLETNKIFGDKSARIHLKANHIAFLEEYQTLTKTPINLWIEDGGVAYLSPLVYMLGQGEIAFKWFGEIIGVRHLRIVPGRKISIGQMARTSFIESGTYKQGEAGWFKFASLEEGAEAVMELPPPMKLKLTVGFLVSNLRLRF